MATAALATDGRARRSTGSLSGLAARWDEIETCGLPDTLRARRLPSGQPALGGDGHLVLARLGDAGVGHPMLDEPAFLERLVARGPGRRASTCGRAGGTATMPGCDPDRAASLLRTHRRVAARR